MEGRACHLLHAPFCNAVSRSFLGGRSKAFFIFSPNKRFIIKSCTAEEIAVAQRLSSDFATHFEAFPQSFLCRILGAYKLSMHGNSFYFFVMENLFWSSESLIHERYDIKGSWVNRGLTVPKNGERVTCALCNQKYRVGDESSLRHTCLYT